jgi:hypothetical protein
MIIDDRELLSDMRHRLHGVVMTLGQLQDLELFKELEDDIDRIINKIGKKLKA